MSDNYVDQGSETRALFWAGELKFSAADRKASPPGGWLYCNGAAVSRTTYAALFAAIGITHGQGNGTTTFNIPDYRGRFLRAQANESTRDPDRATRTAMAAGGNTGDNIGSVQADAIQGHWHQAVAIANMAGGGANNAGYNGGVDYAGIAGVKQPLTDGVNGTPRTTSETRPVNAYIQVFIKT